MSAVATRQSPPSQKRPARRKAATGTSNVQTVAFVALMLLCLALGGMAWYRVARTLQTAKPVKVPTIHPVSGVIWAGRVFSTRQGMANWLRDRGASYGTWEERNPDLARILETP